MDIDFSHHDRLHHLGDSATHPMAPRSDAFNCFSRMNTSPAQPLGFSLIEVLISMLILAFGVLSMGGLQLASLRSVQISSKASTATTLAKDYSEMMRSNSTVAAAVTANPYLFDTSDTSSFSANPSVDCKVNVCTTAQMAVLHVADWAQRVSEQLPGGRAKVCRDTAPKSSNGNYQWACDGSGNLVTIKLGWVDKRDSTESGVTTFGVNVPQVVVIAMTGLVE